MILKPSLRQVLSFSLNFSIVIHYDVTFELLLGPEKVITLLKNF